MNFLRNLFGLSIKSQVMKVIKTRINEVEKFYRSDINQAKYNLKMAISDAKDDFQDDLEKITEKHINSILSKII